MIMRSTFGEVAWAECESVIRRFEDAWREKQRPDISGYLTSESPHSVQLLVELVHIDLEFRLRAGEYARVEDYLWRFAELSDAELLLDLIAAEYALRNRHNPPAWPEEFLLRFPEHIAELRIRLRVDSRTGLFAATRHVELPGAPLSGPPIISGYEIQGELGRGGMGVVYKARDLLLHRTVAVKTFATVPRPESCARFAREAEAIAQLDHPHIVPVYEVGEWHVANGGPTVPFFVMKWYSGGGMDGKPAGPGSDVGAHAKVVETIARAVHHAHQRGVLHRDLKPSNILLDDAGRPCVADFGLAGRVDPDAVTVTAVIAGTPAYMAPEQAKSPKQVSTAADVYGLGAILYHQLTGQAPFAAETPLATLDLVANTPAAVPSAVNPAVPRDLDTICLKCLEKDPARRYASAAEVADDLERWRKGLTIAARQASVLERSWRRVRRNPLVTVLAFTTLATLIGAIIVLYENNKEIRKKEKETKDAYIRECAMRYKLEETLASEKTTRNQLQETLTREQRALYLERVSAAGRLYAANQLPEAWALLDQCPEQYRGWEWRYLNSLRNTNDIAFAGHSGNITKVGFLADGRLVSGDMQGFVRTWNVDKQQPQHTWSFGRLPINALSVHPTKNWVAIATPGSASVWNVDTGQMIAKFKGSNWAAFSPDGTRLFNADSDTMRIWTVPEGEPKVSKDELPPAWESAGELTGHKAPITVGVFARDGKKLVTSGQDLTIRTWDLATLKQANSRPAASLVSGLALVQNGKVLAEARYGSVIFTDLLTGEIRGQLEQPIGEQPAVATGPDDHTVAVSGPNGEVLIWDVLRRETVRVFRGHTGRISALAFGAGDCLASGGSERTVRVWDLKAETGIRTLKHIGFGYGELAISPDGTRVAIGPRNLGKHVEAQSLILDAATGNKLHQLASGPDVVFHPRSGRLATENPKGGATMWDTVSGESWSKSFSAPRDAAPLALPPGRRLAISPNGELLAIWDRRAGGVELWNPADGTSLGMIDTGETPASAIEFTADSARLAVATPKTVTMWDVRSRARVPWGENLPGATAIAFSANGKWLASVENDRVIRLRDAATGREVLRFVSTSLRADVLCFSPDGTRLVTGGTDRTVRVWDVETGRELLALSGLSEAITGIAWDAKNDRIYAIDYSVRVWGTGK